MCEAYFSNQSCDLYMESLHQNMLSQLSFRVPGVDVLIICGLMLSGCHRSVDYLNVDGAVKAMDRIAGCGGLIRDHQGKWLHGFSKFIGFCNPLVAKLWGIFEGLKLCHDKGWRHVQVHC